MLIQRQAKKFVLPIDERFGACNLNVWQGFYKIPDVSIPQEPAGRVRFLVRSLWSYRVVLISRRL